MLGETGLAEYRRAVEPRWRSLDSTSGSWSGERFAVTEAMIGVALAGGDPDELIAVRQHELRTPGAYLEIARVLTEAGRDAEAVEWARRGLVAFDRPWQTPPLREFLAALLRDRGEASEAVALFWEAFERAPSLQSYQRLLEEAGDEASAWKERSLAALRARAERNGPHEPRGRRPGTGPADALVEILGYEGEIEEAWEAATQYGCGDRLWLTLARAREDAHPLDAIDVYEREIFTLIEQKKNHTYRAAVDLLARVRRLADAAGRPERFEDLLERVRTEHRAKRNLKKLLDQKRW